jgi:hypothetical protein
VCELPGLVDLSAGRYAGVVPQQALGLQLALAYAQMYGIRCAHERLIEPMLVYVLKKTL